MANEVDVKVGLQISKNGIVDSIVGNTRSDMTGDVKFAGTQIIGVTPEAIVFPADIIAVGIKVICYKNLSATNFLVLTDGDGVGHKLLPGEAFISRPNVAPTVDPTHSATADTAECHLAILAAGT